MAHEITHMDSVVLYKTNAWHGIGKVIEWEMSPRQAQEAAGHNWEAIKTDALEGSGTTSDGHIVDVRSERHCLNFRSDNGHVLGQVTSSYTNFQPDDMYEMAYACGADVKIETALTLQGGKKIVILLRGETIDVGSELDPVATYFALMNSFDGTMQLQGLPTSVRIVCNNTLQMALGKAPAFKVRHKGDKAQRMMEMTDAIARFKKTGSLFAVKAEALANTDLDKLMERVRESGGLARALADAQAWVDEGVAALGALPESQYRDGLAVLGRYLVERTG